MKLFIVANLFSSVAHKLVRFLFERLVPDYYIGFFFYEHDRPSIYFPTNDVWHHQRIDHPYTIDPANPNVRIYGKFRF